MKKEILLNTYIGDQLKEIDMTDALSDILNEPKECKGLFFRGYLQEYWTGEKYEIKQGFKLLKRKSCPGCFQCRCTKDEIRELIGSGSIITPDIKDGALYSIRITNRHTDWESGIIDDWDLEFFEVKD